MLNKILGQFNKTLNDLEDFMAKEKNIVDEWESELVGLQMNIRASNVDIDKAKRVKKKLAKLIG